MLPESAAHFHWAHSNLQRLHSSKYRAAPSTGQLSMAIKKQCHDFLSAPAQTPATSSVERKIEIRPEDNAGMFTTGLWNSGSRYEAHTVAEIGSRHSPEAPARSSSFIPAAKNSFKAHVRVDRMQSAEKKYIIL